MSVKRYMDSKEIVPGRERPNLGYANVVRERHEGTSLRFRVFLSSTDRPVRLEVGEVVYLSRVFDDARDALRTYKIINSFNDFVIEEARTRLRPVGRRR